VEASGLAHNTKYYWRVVTHHSVDPERLAPSSTVPGDILSSPPLQKRTILICSIPEEADAILDHIFLDLSFC
jgi:hypothetical protein